jgi:hypothetical protein
MIYDSLLLGLLFNLENSGNMFFPHIRSLSDYMASYPKRKNSSKHLVFHNTHTVKNPAITNFFPSTIKYIISICQKSIRTEMSVGRLK